MVQYGGNMARMLCKCGELLSNSQSPNNIVLHVYTDEEWDGIFNCDSICPWLIPLPKNDVWKCPKCQRIYVFGEHNDIPIAVYSLE